MSVDVELTDDLAERIDDYRDDGQSRAEFIAELVRIYETEGTFGTEGYSE